MYIVYYYFTIHYKVYIVYFLQLYEDLLVSIYSPTTFLAYTEISHDWE